MAARAPLLDGVHVPHPDALVESARGEGVVQLVVACRRRVLPWEVEGDYVAGARGFAQRPCLRLPGRSALNINGESESFKFSQEEFYEELSQAFGHEPILTLEILAAQFDELEGSNG